MKSSDPRSTPKPGKGVAIAAIAEGVAESQAVYRIASKKAVKGQPLTGAKRQQATGVLTAFAGSSVMAHDAVMKGVSGRAVSRLWEDTKGTLSTEAILKAVGVSARTAHRIKAEPDKPLDARTTDGLYRLESVRALAAEVLGSTLAADEWLVTEAMGLEFRKPIDLLSTSPGAEAVKTLLQRMKYGVYA